MAAINRCRGPAKRGQPLFGFCFLLPGREALSCGSREVLRSTADDVSGLSYPVFSCPSRRTVGDAFWVAVPLWLEDDTNMLLEAVNLLFDFI